jgi:hypothetical protein
MGSVGNPQRIMQMRVHLAAVIAIATIVPLSARSDEIPNLDVRPVCRGIASQAAEPLATGLPSSFEECVKSEQEVRAQLKHEWSTFSAADRQQAPRFRTREALCYGWCPRCARLVG